jgi:hypothetical protein
MTAAGPFHPERDRVAFTRHLIVLGCQPPSHRQPADGH